MATVAPIAPLSAAPRIELLLCDYVKLRKVRIGPQKMKKTTIDKKLQVASYSWLTIL